MNNQYIVCAAMFIQSLTDDTQHIICSPRHWDTIARNQLNIIYPDFNPCDFEITQGFVDQFCNFLSREEAWLIAERNSQIRYRCGGDTYIKNGKSIGKLFSENLY